MNIRAVKLLLVVLTLNSAVSTAQSRREISETYYEAGTWILFGEYEDALPLYIKLLEPDPDNYNYKYRIGICYLNISGEKEKALPCLLDATEHINPDYRGGKLKENEAPCDALFYLATAYRISNRLNTALDTCRLFYEGMDNNKLYDSVNEPRKIQAATPGVSIARINARQREEQDRALDSLDAIHAREAQSIDRMGQVINEVSTGDESGMIKDAIVKANELQIKHAGEWLRSMYSVAIGDGAEKEFLTRLIAAMSSDPGDDAAEYINVLASYAGSGLKETLAGIDPYNWKTNRPEDVIDYLLSSAGKPGYNKDEIFETLSKLINASGKTAEDILTYLNTRAGLKLWGLWILMGVMATSLIIFVFKRGKKKKEKAET